ncbi:MAG TPA: ribonuclease D [Porticoccaceae bacterium]|nr:ribonuclease D [Porticoccaceae bacterium]
MTAVSQDVVLVASAAQLEAAAAAWRNCPVLALDTEFMRTDTFFPRLALVQVAAREQVWLIDPLAVADLAPLAAMLVDPGVVKVLHSCSEDLEVFQHALGCRPAPLYDTQVAAALTGHGFSLGYGALVQRLLGIELDKQETRSDWLQRPLSAAQLAYAAADVHYLLPSYRQLADAAERQGKNAWMAEEMERVLAQAAAVTPSCEQYRRVKGAGRLKRIELAALRELAAWRDERARASNRPRGHIVNDAELLVLAAARPRDRGALAALAELRPRVIREFGDALLDAVAATAALAPEDYPELLDQGPPERAARELIRACRDWLAERAAALGVAPEMLARRADLEALARAWLAGEARLPPALAGGWRQAVIGAELLEFARAWSAAAP